MTEKERWEKAINHAREYLAEYMNLAPRSSWFGIATIQEVINLYEAGDRSNALLERLEGIE